MVRSRRAGREWKRERLALMRAAATAVRKGDRERAQGLIHAVAMIEAGPDPHWTVVDDVVRGVHKLTSEETEK